MKLRAVFLLVGLGAAAMGQQSNGYVFFAPGGVTSGSQTSMTLHVGGGGEGILGKGVGVGAEIGAIAPKEAFSCAVGAFSPNAYYHFIHGSGRKLDPFVTGGYTLLFRSGSANLYNFGGGVNYWVGERLACCRDWCDRQRENLVAVWRSAY